MEHIKCLVAAGNILEAHTWKGLLETLGIEVELRGEALMGGVGELSTDQQNIELWVLSHNADLARNELAKLKIDQANWYCLQCNEKNEGNFEICWHCGEEKPKTL